MAFTSDGHLYRQEQYPAQLLDGKQLVFSPNQDLGPVRLQRFQQPAHQ